MPATFAAMLGLVVAALAVEHPADSGGSKRFPFELPSVPHAAARAGARGRTMLRRQGGRADAPAPNLEAMGLNAKDFGAVGDGQADDAPALQKAIDAATGQGRALLLPAGVYRINSTLNIMSSARFHYLVPGPGFAKHPLRLVGEGYELTRIIAAVEMHALLNFSANNSKVNGAAAPSPTENQFLSDLALEAAGLANFSLFAPGIARSRFQRVDFGGALSVGASIGYGWCNYFEQCRFGGNGVGLHTNKIDVVDSVFEGNTGVVIYASGGAQYHFTGSHGAVLPFS
jgi:hypothetical protein